ncbi:hypothetical protein D3C87_279410 [compost metagenome]
MDFRKNLRPLNRVELAPPVQEAAVQTQANEVLFETPSLEVTRAPTSHDQAGSVPTLQVVEKKAPVPPQTIQKAIPTLEVKSTQRESLPQPVAEAKATAEPAEAGGSNVAWPFGETKSVESQEDSPVTAEDPAAPWPFKTDSQTQVVEQAPEIPALKVVEKEVSQEIPQLQVIDREKVEVPALQSFKATDVVYLLLGKSKEDDDIVLIQTLSERAVRTKGEEGLRNMLAGIIDAHVFSMISKDFYDFKDRQGFRRTASAQVSVQDKARGVEKTFGLLDTGNPTDGEVSRYMKEFDVDDKEAISALAVPPHYAYTWALVKVKIDQQFGDFKLSDLMPNI